MTKTPWLTGGCVVSLLPKAKTSMLFLPPLWWKQSQFFWNNFTDAGERGGRQKYGKNRQKQNKTKQKKEKKRRADLFPAYSILLSFPTSKFLSLFSYSTQHQTVWWYSWQKLQRRKMKHYLLQSRVELRSTYLSLGTSVFICSQTVLTQAHFRVPTK